MDPPTYEEARHHPSLPGVGTVDVPPPPSYDASLSAPPAPLATANPADPPPAYREAVTLPPDPFPVLAPPTVTSLPANAAFIHPTTHVGVSPPLNRQQAVVVVSSQPLSGGCPISLSHLGEIPGLVRCPYCRNTVTTKVTYRPGAAAWGLCILLTVMGLVCGICLIPFMVRGLQDVRHSCPQCGNHLYTYTR